MNYMCCNVRVCVRACCAVFSAVFFCGFFLFKDASDVCEGFPCLLFSFCLFTFHPLTFTFFLFFGSDYASLLKGSGSSVPLSFRPFAPPSFRPSVPPFLRPSVPASPRFCVLLSLPSFVSLILYPKKNFYQRQSEF